MRARGDVLWRGLRLIATLRHPQSLSALARQLGVTERTMRRDITMLNALGIRVWCDYESRTYRLSRPDMRLSDLARCRFAEAVSDDARQASRRA